MTRVLFAMVTVAALCGVAIAAGALLRLRRCGPRWISSFLQWSLCAPRVHSQCASCMCGCVCVRACMAGSIVCYTYHAHLSLCAHTIGAVTKISRCGAARHRVEMRECCAAGWGCGGTRVGPEHELTPFVITQDICQDYLQAGYLAGCDAGRFVSDICGPYKAECKAAFDILCGMCKVRRGHRCTRVRECVADIGRWPPGVRNTAGRLRQRLRAQVRVLSAGHVPSPRAMWCQRFNRRGASHRTCPHSANAPMAWPRIRGQFERCEPSVVAQVLGQQLTQPWPRLRWLQQ